MEPSRRCYCLSKARDEPAGALPTLSPAELAALRPSELRKRAATLGLADEAIAAAEDADEPKEAMIALVVAAQPPGEDPRTRRGGVTAALRQELEGLKMAALHKRARAGGID